MIQTVYGQINEWNQPERHSLTRMFLTRLCGLPCVALECKQMLEESIGLFSRPIPTLHRLSLLLMGLASTVLLGIIFSPTLNYRVHTHFALIPYDI